MRSYFTGNVDNILPITTALRSLTATSGGVHSGQKGCKMYEENVRPKMAFPAGTIIMRATQRYKNAGNGPKHSRM